MSRQEQYLNDFISFIFGLDPNQHTISKDQLENLIFPNKEFRIIGPYGKGSSGLVLQIQEIQSGNMFALKIIPRQKFDKREFDIQNDFSHYGMAPKVFHVVEIKGQNPIGQPVLFHIAIMEPIYMTLTDFINSNADLRLIYKPFECLITKKYIFRYPNPVLHGDMTSNNIAILNDRYTLGFIDFGWSFQKPKVFQVLDSIPLIGGLKGFPKPRVDPLIKYLLKLYNKMFSINLNYDNYVFSREVGGYVYDFKNGKVLHSYNWNSEKDIVGGFPKINPPTVDGK